VGGRQDKGSDGLSAVGWDLYSMLALREADTQGFWYMWADGNPGRSSWVDVQ